MVQKIKILFLLLALSFGAYAQPTPTELAAVISAVNTDMYVIGQSAQTAVVNNILTTTSGAAATDVLGERAFAIQVISTGTGGTFIFEGSNDNTNFVSLNVFNVSVSSPAIINTAITATSSNIIYVGGCMTRYIRLRIVTTITGGSIRAYSSFTQTIPSSGILAVATSSATSSTSASISAGQTAHSAAVTGNPVRGGTKTKTTNDITLANNDASDLVSTTDGSLIIKSYAAPELDWTYAAAASGIVNTTTAVTFKAAGGASLRNYITGVQIYSEALGAATEVAIRDGAAGTVIWRIKIPAGGLALTNIEFPTPLRGTAATLLEVVTLTASVTGAVYFNSQGYVAP